MSSENVLGYGMVMRRPSGVTVTEAARALGVTRQRVHQIIDEHGLAVSRIDIGSGRHVRFLRAADVRRLARARAAVSAASISADAERGR